MELLGTADWSGRIFSGGWIQGGGGPTQPLSRPPAGSWARSVPLQPPMWTGRWLGPASSDRHGRRCPIQAGPQCSAAPPTSSKRITPKSRIGRSARPGCRAIGQASVARPRNYGRACSGQLSSRSGPSLNPAEALLHPSDSGRRRRRHRPVQRSADTLARARWPRPWRSATPSCSSRIHGRRSAAAFCWRRIFEEAGLPTDVLHVLPGGQERRAPTGGPSRRAGHRLHRLGRGRTHYRRAGRTAPQTGASRARRQLSADRPRRCRRRAGGRRRMRRLVHARGPGVHGRQPAPRGVHAARRLHSSPRRESCPSSRSATRSKPTWRTDR